MLYTQGIMPNAYKILKRKSTGKRLCKIIRHRLDDIIKKNHKEIGKEDVD
jgi:hypothetical protein